MKSVIQILVLAVLFISCRQDVIPPDNPAGNINEPVYSRTNFSYTFTINASNITRTVTNNTFLDTFRSRIHIVVNDYSSGRVEILVEDDDVRLYSAVINQNTSGMLQEINGFRPEIITINFINFTGKFRLTLTDGE
jgi:hypothetical protein